MLEEFITKTLKGRYLFHFTDGRNLPSIKKYGILSSATSEKEKVKVIARGGDAMSLNSAKRLGLDGYVSLSMTDNHPMSYVAERAKRIRDVTYLSIRPEILRVEGTKACLVVANTNGAEILGLEEALERMDLEVLYGWTDWKNPEVKARRQAVRKYEILVPDRVPLERIVF
jgi:hypothetical protein